MALRPCGKSLSTELWILLRLGQGGLRLRLRLRLSRRVVKGEVMVREKALRGEAAQ